MGIEEEIEKTPSSHPTSAWDVFSYVFYLLITALAAYFGWVLGREHAFAFWSFIQAIGAALGSVFRSGFQAIVRLSR